MLWSPPYHAKRPRVYRLPAGWFRRLVALLALVTLMSLATARRLGLGWVLATTLLVMGVWAACGGSGGGGGSSPPAPAPIVSLSPTGLALGQENLGLTTPPQTVTLSNTGNSLLSISNIAINWVDFHESNNCGGSLSAGANCTISVTYSPTFAGSVQSALAISDNASGSPQMVNLSATGVPPVTPPGSYWVVVNGNGPGNTHGIRLSATVQ